MAETRELEDRPGLLGSYLRAAVGAVPGTGLIPGLGGRADDVPDTVLRTAGVTVDPRHLAEYARVCGFTLRDELPVTYPHILAFGMQLALMTDRRFPFGVLGAVHVANRITWERPIASGETLDLCVSATPLQPHRSGHTFDLVTEVRVGGELVWHEASTNLHRGEKHPDAPAEPRMGTDGLEAEAEWKVPGDIGRRYAGVSGDRNPIHLHPLTARAFGFPRAIAHGMWTKARVLAALEGRLPAGGTIDVRFVKPLLLPSRVELATGTSGGATRFAVRKAGDEKLHLTGEVTS
jgi:acyl dehydratase